MSLPLRAAMLLASSSCLQLLAGCRLSSHETAEYTGPRNDCAAGCGAGNQCLGGRCVGESTNYPIALQVVVPDLASDDLNALSRASTTVPGVEFLPYPTGTSFTYPPNPVRSGAQTVVKLPGGVRIVGVLARARLDSFAVPVPSVVRLRSTNVLPGIRPNIYEIHSERRWASEELVVPPGTYTMQVKPYNLSGGTDAGSEAGSPSSVLTEELPGWQRTTADGQDAIIELVSGQMVQLDAPYPATRKLHIDLTDQGGVPLLARNQAHDLYVWDVTGDWLASSVVGTCKAGQMTSAIDLTLAPQLPSHRYVLRVGPPRVPCSDSTLTIFPTFEFDFQSLDIAGTGRITLPVQASDLSVGVGHVFSEKTRTPVVADIVFHRQPDIGVQSPLGLGVIDFHARSSPGDGGYYFIGIPGTYTADVVPDVDLTSNAFGSEPPGFFAACTTCTVLDPNGQLGQRTSRFEVSGTTLGLNFELRRRVPLRARAVGFDGKTFDSLSVFEAVPSQRASLLEPPPFMRGEAVQLGAFTDKSNDVHWNIDLTDRGSQTTTPIGVDPGIYDLIVRPPTASSYPWVVMPAVDLLAQRSIINMEAKVPVIVQGTLVDEQGQPVPYAVLRPRAVLEDSRGRSTVLVGETRTDAQGNYELVLPQNLGS